jgi:hypothetical protein
MKQTMKFATLLSPTMIGIFVLFFCLQITVVRLNAADEKKATIKLSFIQKDSAKICKAIVTSDGLPVKGTELHFYVKRLYNPLPVGKAIATDENGEASANFPIDLPGDANGNFTVIAKIEDDDTYGTVETRSEVKWGALPNSEKDSWSNRSLSASRDKAPMYLIIVSNLIIAVIWGTIFYIIFQIFRIRKESKLLKKDNK